MSQPPNQTNKGNAVSALSLTVSLAALVASPYSLSLSSDANKLASEANKISLSNHRPQLAITETNAIVDGDAVILQVAIKNVGTNSAAIRTLSLAISENEEASFPIQAAAGAILTPSDTRLFEIRVNRLTKLSGTSIYVDVLRTLNETGKLNVTDHFTCLEMPGQEYVDQLVVGVALKTLQTATSASPK